MAEKAVGRFQCSVGEWKYDLGRGGKRISEGRRPESELGSCSPFAQNPASETLTRYELLTFN